MSKPCDYRGRDFKASLFNKIQSEVEKSRSSQNPIIGLAMGDTWYDLPSELRQPLESEPWLDRLSRYGETQGLLELRTRLITKFLRQNVLPVSTPGEIQVTFGSTAALFIAMRRLLKPGDEVLTLAPYWSILRMVAASAEVTLVEVPVFDRLPINPSQTDWNAMLTPYVSARTSAIYFNNPNNPTGVMLRRGHLENLARFAMEKDLWVFSDEAYEDFVWSDEPYLSIGSLPGMFERTVSIFSMSKTYAAAGLRMGCTVAPVGVTATLNPALIGIGYEPNREAQIQWVRALERRHLIIPRLQDAYRKGLLAARQYLKVPYLRPEGAFYLFLDLRDRWTGMSADEKVKRMVQAGVAMAPGELFGRAYQGWARFCYTCEPPEKIALAAQRVQNL